MEPVRLPILPTHTEGQAPLAPQPTSAAQHAPAVPASSTQLAGLSLVDAYATLGSSNAMITNVVIGENNQIAQIRVLDAVTHQVIAASPPDSIARMQSEMQAYQNLAQARVQA